MKWRSMPAPLPTEESDLEGLSIVAQWTLMRLTLSNDLKADGCAPLMIIRWGNRWAAQPCIAEVQAGLAELEQASLVAMDHGKGEIFHRRFFAWERIGRQPRRVAAAWDQSLTRGAVIKELAQDALMAEVAAGAGESRPLSKGRAFVFERDGWRCVACGWGPGDAVPLAPTGRPMHRGLEVDHVFPKSKGGVDGPENFQTLCTSCNASKGARI
ncbi:hypothetical protein JCM9957A_50620 [Kineosporia succinea]